MGHIDFRSLARKRQPTKKEKARYKRWVKYLSNSRLSESEVHQRAAAFTSQKKEPA